MNLSIYIQSGGLVIISSDSGVKWYQSLKWLLFIIYFFIGFIPLVLFSFIMSDTLKSYFADTNEREILYQANKIAGTIQKSEYLTDPEKKDSFEYEMDEKSNEENFRIIVVNSAGVVVVDTNKTATGKVYIVPEVLMALDGKDEANLRWDERAVYAAAYIENGNSEKIGAVLIVSPFDEVYDLIDVINHKWMMLTIGISVIIAFIVFFVSQLILAPLKNILETIKKISEGQLHQRIEISGKNEYTEIADAINNMTEQLEQVESSRQEFVSNVSHELKTPLSSIKVLCESILLQEDMPTEMYREFLQDINSEVDRMTNIVNDLLSLVKLDHREDALNIQETDINKMIQDVMKRLYPLAEKKNIELLYESNKDMTIEADEMKLSLAISNLIENGIKYTPDNGMVKVTIDGDHQNVFITVQDTGIGISEEEQSKVFKRFYRVDKTRDRETGGTGLGLAITHATVMLHNGSIKIVSSEGNGATFIVRLPIKHIED